MADEGGQWPNWVTSLVKVTAIIVAIVFVVASCGSGAPPLAAAFIGGGMGSVGTAAAASTTAAAVAAGKVIVGTSGVIIAGVVGSQIGKNISYAKKSKSSGKDDSTDAPSWAKRVRPKSGETSKQYANRIMNDKYGVGNWRTGPKSEFNKIIKWATRHLKLK